MICPPNEFSQVQSKNISHRFFLQEEPLLLTEAPLSFIAAPVSCLFNGTFLFLFCPVFSIFPSSSVISIYSIFFAFNIQQLIIISPPNLLRSIDLFRYSSPPIPHYCFPGRLLTCHKSYSFQTLFFIRSVSSCLIEK